MLFPHLITGPSPKEDWSPEEWRLSQEGKTCFFTVVNLVSNPILTPRIEERSRELILLHIEMVRGAQCKILVRFKARAG